MDMVFRTSDTELMAKAGKLIVYTEYAEAREIYIMRNPKKYVGAGVHRRIMQEAVSLAKQLIDKGATEEELRNACMYLYICIDARKYRLNFNKAYKDLKIMELIQKYQINNF